MGNVLDPKPPQWERKQKSDGSEEESEDRVVLLATQLLNTLTSDTDPVVVQLAALRLLQKGVILRYRQLIGVADTQEALRQATEMAQNYIVKSPDGDDGEEI